jgi:DNA invertase Pin-like site-specific DNA recombinase
MKTTSEALPRLRCIGYVRVSTEEQATSRAGLDGQRETIVAEVERRGWELVEIVEDAGYSAKNLDRPGIQRALSMLQGRGRQADALMVAKLDRLSRSIANAGELLERSLARGWSLVALDVAVDTSSPSGEAMAGMMAVWARLERRMIGERTKTALAAKRAQGVRLGRRRELPDAVVTWIVGQHRSGAALAAIARALNEQGEPTAHGGAMWYPSTVRAVVRSQDAALLAGAA